MRRRCATKKRDGVARVDARRAPPGAATMRGDAEHGERRRTRASITGPNSAPTPPVPRRCSANSADQDDDRERHDAAARSAGVATSSPSTALSTEIAGVIMPSP